MRPSNTEPLLRLNVEAPTAERMAALRDEMLDVHPPLTIADSKELERRVRRPRPACHPALSGRAPRRADVDAGAQTLTCTQCGRIYEIRDGIPVLLLDEARLPEDGAV